ncbi:M1 family metallopeptidase [Streptomyces sp. NPDC057877]|uniref:M1 family metallopeptidase n=1 Tax=Streptomyces sp. NPDC057877 TaxID=3346269 RepID=UPI0036AE1026
MRTPHPRTGPALTVVAALTAACAGGGVSGAPGDDGLRDPYFPRAGNGGYDVTHYALTLAYTPTDRHLTGTATVTARATEDLSALNLDLSGLDVDSVAVDRRPARWNRAGQELTIRPRDELDAGAVFRVTVRYGGTPETITDPDGSEEGWLPTADGALGLGQPTGSMAWFPGNHHPSDKASYDISVTVPRGLRAVSNGQLTREPTTRGGRTTYAWRTAEPMASHVATVAIGRYDIQRYDITARDGRLPVHTAVDPAQADASRAVLRRLPDVMAWAERNFGPYPFASTGVIVERPEDIGYALETQNRPVFPGAPDLTLLVHELAHQWYGDSVTPRTWRDMWLSEGFATYAEWLWREDQGGETAEQTFDALYESGPEDTSDADGDGLWAFPPADPPDAARISGRPVYDRAAMALHRVRQILGDDTAFRALLRDWASAQRHGTADTEEFTAWVERRAPGSDFSGVWRDWLYGDGKPPR